MVIKGIFIVHFCIIFFGHFVYINNVLLKIRHPLTYVCYYFVYYFAELILIFTLKLLSLTAKIQILASSLEKSVSIFRDSFLESIFKPSESLDGRSESVA